MVQVQCDDDLGIGAGGEVVFCFLLEPSSDATVVVELAVDDGVDAVGRGVEGLGGRGGEVIDTQSYVAEC